VHARGGALHAASNVSAAPSAGSQRAGPKRGMALLGLASRHRSMALNKPKERFCDRLAEGDGGAGGLGRTVCFHGWPMPGTYAGVLSQSDGARGRSGHGSAGV